MDNRSSAHLSAQTEERPEPSLRELYENCEKQRPKDRNPPCMRHLPRRAGREAVYQARAHVRLHAVSTPARAEFRVDRGQTISLKRFALSMLLASRNRSRSTGKSPTRQDTRGERDERESKLKARDVAAIRAQLDPNACEHGPSAEDCPSCLDATRKTQRWFFEHAPPI